MADLPEDLMIRILLNLPVKSLVRFRCVSKIWCDLIRSPGFINMHLNYEKRDEIMLIKHAETTPLPLHANKLLDPFLQTLEIPGLKLVVADSILQSSCNGLICITSDHENYFVFNPALRELKRIPPRPFDAADASKPFCGKVGFGFDPKTDQYKVVSLERLEEYGEIDINPRRRFRARIYNLTTESWRETDDEIPSLIHGPCYQVFFNGRCHWLASLRSHMYILSFDFSAEVFGVVEFSDTILVENREDSTCLSVFNHRLTLIQEAENRSHDGRCTDIWVMDEYGVKESWAKYYTIQSEIERPLSFWKDILFVQGSYGRLLSLSLHSPDEAEDEEEEEDEFEVEVEALPIFAADYTMEMVNYRESLVSFK